MALGKVLQGIHVARVAVHVDREYRASARTNLGCDVIYAHRPSVWLDVHENRGGAYVDRRKDRGRDREGWHDDLVARSQSCGGDSQVKRSSTAGSRDTVYGITILCERFL